MNIPKQVKTKNVAAIVLVAILITTVGCYFTFAQSSSTTFTISPGIYPSAASYTIYKEDSYYYAKNAYGVNVFSGTDAATVIQSAINSARHGQTIFLKKAIYYINTPLIITKEINLVGEGGVQERERGVAFESTVLDNDYYIKVIANETNLYGGSIKNIQFYNPTVTSKVQYGILLYSTSNRILGFTIENIRTCYIRRGVVLDGYVWFCSFRNIYVDSYNTDFIGDYAIGLTKSDATTDIWKAPKLNDFRFINHYAHGLWTATIFIDHPRATYNLFDHIQAMNEKYDLACIYDAGVSNMVYNLHTQDLALSTSNFKGLITIEKKYAVEEPPPGEVRYGGFGAYYRRLLIADAPVHVKFLGGAFRNEIEIENFEQPNIVIDATDAGIDNKIIISEAMLRDATRTFTITVYGHVDLQGYGVENSGTATITASTSVTFNHGLAGTPTLVLASFYPSVANWTWTATSTQITITVSPSGTYTVYWYAKYKP